MVTIQKILQRHFEGYARTHKLSLPQARAGRALSACRTAALGGHVQRCPNGHVEHVWYNSCRHRSCPQCNALERERWLERQRARLLDCAHHHLVFTIAHELNAIWLLNTERMMQTLFGAVRDTLAELLADARYLGAQPGMVLALHTWGRSLGLHPHIHALVSDGGLCETQWVLPRRSHFLPARVLMMLFRGKLLARVRELRAREALRLPESMSEERFAALLNRLGRKKWHVYLSARYAHGQGVSLYLARYVKGGPLKNTQLVRACDTEIAFAYRPHNEATSITRHATLALAPDRFLARLLVHAPEPRRHSVRYYGLYAHGCTAALAIARAIHQQPPAQAPEPLQWQCYLARLGLSLLTRCPRCGTPLVRATLVPARSASP